PEHPSYCSVATSATPRVDSISLHDALPIWRHFDRDGAEAAPGMLRRIDLGTRAGGQHQQVGHQGRGHLPDGKARAGPRTDGEHQDRKSTRLNSSHVKISYAVFCLKKKKKRI